MSPAVSLILDHFEKSQKPFSEHEVLGQFQSKKVDIDFSQLENFAEYLAFCFCSDYRWGKGEGWGTYYGPMMVGKTDDGLEIETPNLKQVTPEVIAHWENRAEVSNNPILRRRYADLVWDLSKPAIGKAPNFLNAQKVIDATISIANGRLYAHEVFEFGSLRRALNMAGSLKDVVRQSECKKALFDFEKAVADDHSCGLWGHCFDFLIVEKICPITREEEVSIIKELEDRWSRLCSLNAAKCDPWAIQSVAIRLLDYFNKKGDQSKVDLLLKSVEDSFRVVSDSAVPLQKRAWFRNVYDLYSRFGRKDDATRIMMEIRKMGELVTGSLKSHSVSAKISESEIESFIESFTDEGSEKALAWLGLHFTPKKHAIVELLKNLSANSPLAFFFTQQILDKDGGVVASVGPLDEDLEGHVVRQITQQLATSSIFIKMIFERLESRYAFCENDVIDFITQSPLFDDEDADIAKYAIKKYFEGDLIGFSHAVVPQIEAAVRRLLDKSGGVTHKLGRNGEFFNKTFDELLRDPILEKAFGVEGPLADVPLYFRVLFTDQRGWNFRNLLCHGLISKSDLNQSVADRILHALLILGMLRMGDAASN